MPTYDYICDACGHEFEAFEPITSEPQKDCPACKADKLRRKIGPGAAILFKGAGFYQTDYRSESYKKAAKAESSSNGSTESSSSKADGGAKGGDSSKSSSTTSSTSSTSGSSSGGATK